MLLDLEGAEYFLLLDFAGEVYFLLDDCFTGSLYLLTFDVFGLENILELFVDGLRYIAPGLTFLSAGLVYCFGLEYFETDEVFRKFSLLEYFLFTTAFSLEIVCLLISGLTILPVLFFGIGITCFPMDVFVFAIAGLTCLPTGLLAIDLLTLLGAVFVFACGFIV